MIDTASSDSLRSGDTQVLAMDIALEMLEAELGQLESDPGVEVLTSGDFTVVGPCSSRGGGARVERRAVAPAAPHVDPLIGLVLADRYRIVAPIGCGGMGVVYKVEHTQIGKLLAMKLLAGGLAHNPEVARRFKREALTVSRLQSPNTVQVFDFGVSEGLTYLVMELVNGDNLGRILGDQGPMPFLQVGQIILQVCNSLAEAHQKGIIHRDIKPENIMLLSASGGAVVAKVLDFGLAKLRDAEGLSDVSNQGSIMGTPNYMSPEQVRGDAVDARTDVYGVGALMYRLLTGQYPFSGSPMNVLSQHLSRCPIPPAARAPELQIPPGISGLVMRALSKNPGNRFQSIEELRASLLEELHAAEPRGAARALDPDPRGSMHRAVEPGTSNGGPAGAALATRDEVDAYERKLRRKRYGAAGVIAALAVTAVIAGASLIVEREARPSGVEGEPNNTPADATALPLGQPMTGYLGKRMDPSHGDRDFYAIDLPEGATGAEAFLRLRVSALPNFAMCTFLYQPGFAEALGQYCVGRASRDLIVPALKLDPGRYFIAVLQDMDENGREPRVHENISDMYTVQAESVIPEPGIEIEPNDQIASATPVGLSLPCSAAIGWRRDEDVFCVSEAVFEPIRWKVRAGFRDSGVLEVTPIRQGEEAAPVRLRPDEASRILPGDAVSPWQSAPISAEGGAPRCLRVRLTTDPWTSERAAGAPSGGSEAYVVEAEAMP